MKIWKCPNGCAGKRGPARPRRNASVRYCLACSSKSDMLVERVCETAERERTERKAKREAKSEKNRRLAREGVAKRFTVEGVDLRELWRKMLRLPTVPKSPRFRRIKLHVRHGKFLPRSVAGRAWLHENRIQVSVGGGTPLSWAIGTMLHELAHHVAYALHGRAGAGHGSEFTGVLNDLTADWKARNPEHARKPHRRATVAIGQDEAPKQPDPIAPQESSCNASNNAVG